MKCLVSLITIIFAVIAVRADDWKLVWHDEFDTNGAPNPQNWSYEHGFVRNEELQWYQPENAWCTNGFLVIEARREHKPNPDYVPGNRDRRKSREWIDCTSASLTTRHLQEFRYGKFEMRARIDTQMGSWPAFWTLGGDIKDVHWPACGEIDIMEFYTGKVLANIGYGLDGKMKWSSVRKPIWQFRSSRSREFHTWTMEWDDKKIALFLDGKRMNYLKLADADKADTGNPFHQPVSIILNQAIGGQSGGDPSHSTFPIRFEVDWVRVYQRAN